MNWQAGVQGRNKTLVQSLKQFHECFYLAIQEGTTHAMVRLQRIAFWQCFQACPTVSAISMGLK